MLCVFALIMLLHQLAMRLHRSERKALVAELSDSKAEVEMLRIYAAHFKATRSASRRNLYRAPTLRNLARAHEARRAPTLR